MSQQICNLFPHQSLLYSYLIQNIIPHLCSRELDVNQKVKHHFYITFYNYFTQTSNSASIIYVSFLNNLILNTNIEMFCFYLRFCLAGDILYLSSQLLMNVMHILLLLLSLFNMSRFTENKTTFTPDTNKCHFCSRVSLFSSIIIIFM